MQGVNSNFTFRLYLDTRYINSNPNNLGKFEVKIRATSKHTKKIKLIKTGIYAEEHIFNALYPSYVPKRIRAKKTYQDSIGAIANKEENQILKDKIDKELLEWKNADTSEIRTFDQLKKNRGFVSGSVLFSEWVENHCKRDISISNAERVRSAEKKLNKYFKKIYGDVQMSLYDITPKLLNDWESWCLNEEGLKFKTQINYSVDIRTVLNYAIKSDGCEYNRNSYPFYLKDTNTEGYIIKEDNDRPVQKYINDAERSLFMNYTPQTDLEQLAQDIWVFSYLSAGMNATDIYNLKKKDFDLSNNQFIYYRKKTKRQVRQIAKPVTIHPKHLEIIERHKGSNEYVFNLKSNYENPKKLTDQMHKQLKKIREKIGLSKNFSFMSARNSAFTNLSKVATPEAIMETLGTHSNLKTLKGYIKKLNKQEKTKDLYKSLHES